MRAIPSLPRAFGAIALTLACFGLPACMMGSSHPYTSAADLQPVGLLHRWESQIGLLAGESVDKAWRVGDSIYVATNHKRLMRFVAASGVKAWDIKLGLHTQHIFRPVDVDDTHLLVVNDETAYILDKASGLERVSKALGFIATSNPLVDPATNTLCVGGLEFFHGIYLDRLEGQKWVTASPGDQFVASPLLVGKSLVLASRKGLLWNILASDGNYVWRDRKTNGEVVGGLATDGSSVYIPCLDNRLYAFNFSSGGELWEPRLEGTLDKTPIPVRSQVLVPSSGKGLYSIASENGDIQWVAEGVTQVATITGDHLWAQDSSGNLKSISLDSGEVLSSTPLPAAGLPVFNTEDDLVILINNAGSISAYAPQ